MSKSYFPTDRAGQIDWHNNFAKEFPKVGEKLGSSQAEITNAVNDSKYAAYLLKTLGPEIESDPGHAAHAVLEGQSLGDDVDFPSEGAPTAVRPGIDMRRQARAERIRSHPNYTEATGKQLRIVPGAKLDPKSYKAELGQPRRAGNFVTIPFRKADGEVKGINLYRQCKGEKTPQRIQFFFRTPAIDTTARPSEECTYTARAVINDQEIGQPSDTVTVMIN